MSLHSPEATQKQQHSGLFSPNESCNVASDQEESTVIIQLKDKHSKNSLFLEMEKGEEERKKKLFEQAKESHYSNHKRPKPQFQLAQERREPSPSRILKLSKDVSAIVTSPESKKDQALIVERGTRIFIEKDIPELKMV
jgi:hypothetical protein